MDFQVLMQQLGVSGSSGTMSMDVVQELQKALSAGYGTDQSQLTQASALRIQSLESTMLSTIQENKHFRLMNRLAKSNATATVDEWTENSNVGGFPGGSTNSESGVIAGFQGQYNRRVGLVKYLMTRREVTFVASIQDSQVSAEAAEYQNGAKQLLTDAEYLSFEGDSTVVPTEFDGIGALVAANAGSDHVIDVRGGTFDNITKVNYAGALVSGNGNFGTLTDLYVSQNTQADFDNYLDPAFRVPLPDVQGGGISIGAPVVGIRTSWGNIANQHDVFIREDTMLLPFELIMGGQFAALATANNTFKPANVTVANGAQAGSQFDASWAGTYYYGVTGINANGQSTCFVTAQATVNNGDGVTLTITPSAGNTETGYVLYRGTQNGPNAVSDLHQFIRIPRAGGGGNTTYIDKNADIPGTTKAYGLNMTPGDKAITWRQFLPMMKFPLYPTVSATLPWAQLLFGYLRLGKAKHHVLFKNILPKNQVWRPNTTL